MNLSKPRIQGSSAIRLISLLSLLYLFLVAIDLMGGSFKILAGDSAKGLFEGISNPFAGLAIGILATVLVQSSSATTSMVVGAVGAGQFPLEVAVFTIMGCNIGTTITNTLVSLGHMRQDQEFRRAFAGSTMHDFFNLMAVAIFMPLEIATGWLERSASALSSVIYDDSMEGGKIANPLKDAYRAVSEPLKEFIKDDLGLSHTMAGSILLVISLAAAFFALIWITKIMKGLMLARLERSLNRVLAKSGVLAILIGLVMTVAVQSSSVTTSLMVPLFAAGILRLENGFPVTLGANIGTTVTALLAAMASNHDGLTIAFVHLFFNVAATVVIYSIPPLRRIPIRLAQGLANLTAKNKAYALLYVIVAFVVAPLLGNIIFG
ncbi:MAG: Na/Pi symporter [Planctomycetes bacterium]|nr:Na/Pi symporter [Planctomycetota bacterium]